MRYLKTNITQIRKASNSEKKKLSNAVEMLEVILNSNVFKERFMELQFSGNSGLSNQELFEVIFDGNEIADPKKDTEMDLNILMYYSNGYSGGTANPELNRIRINRKYATSTPSICKTIMHEWLHNMGFAHQTALDLHSVPYAVGDLVQDLIREYGNWIIDEGIEKGKKLIIKRPWYFLWLIETMTWE